MDILCGRANGAALHLDHHADHADVVDQVGTGLAVLAFVLGLPGVYANDEETARDKCMDEVKGVRASVLAAEKKHAHA
jgi:hypothetical protein